MPLLTRNTCPSGCRTCISRAFHGMSVGGKTTSSPSATHCLCTSSTSATHTDIQTPLSVVSSPSGPNVELFAPLPRPPCAPRQRKISHSPDPTAPNVGGVPQSQHFFQPHFSNHAKLSAMSDTFKIGVMCFASIGAEAYHAPRLLTGGVAQSWTGAISETKDGRTKDFLRSHTGRTLLILMESHSRGDGCTFQTGRTLVVVRPAELVSQLFSS
jgi:hypothetical protein